MKKDELIGKVEDRPKAKAKAKAKEGTVVSRRANPPPELDAQAQVLDGLTAENVDIEESEDE